MERHLFTQERGGLDRRPPPCRALLSIEFTQLKVGRQEVSPGNLQADLSTTPFSDRLYPIQWLRPLRRPSQAVLLGLHHR